MLALAINGLTLYIILAVVIFLLLLGSLVLVYIYLGNKLFARIFGRREPKPLVDRSPLEIDQSNVIGKGRNWFYTNRMEFMNVRVDAFDGTKLAGYYRPSSDKNCRNVLILIHGYDEHPTNVSAYAKLFMTKIQCHVLIVSQRAHHMSGGKFCSYGLYESVDLNSWIEYMNNLLGTDLRIYIFGRCMGAMTALLAAQQDDFSDNVAGIIADSPYDDLKTVLLAAGRRKYKMNCNFLMRWVERCARIRFGFDMERCECALHAVQIRVPVLIFHGENDHIVDPESSRRIYDKITSPKRMVIVANADHMEAYDKAPALYEKEIEDFIEKCVIRLIKRGRM